MFSLHSPVVRIGPWLLLAVLVGAAAFGITTASEAGSFGGDFPSFHGAGSIVLDGAGADLYDPIVQQEAQSERFPEGGYLFFAYPPYTALLYAGLAVLPYDTAFLVHTVLAVMALIGAIAAFRPFARGMLDGPTRLGIASAVAVATYPVLRSVLGGQNATFSLLLLVLVARFDHDNRPTATGLAAAAMLFKPQFGMLVILALLLGRRWRATAWAAIGAVVWFLLGAIVAGPAWVSVWLDAVRAFGGENLVVNGSLMVSVLGWIQNLFGTDLWTYVVTGVVVASVAAPLGIGLVTKRWSEVPWYAIAPLIVLASPSALYYDTAMVLVTVGTIAAWLAGRRVALGVVVVAISWTQAIASEWSPLFIPILVIAIMLAIGSGTVLPRLRALAELR